MRIALLLALSLVACNREKRHAAPKDVQGTLSIEGKAVDVTACRAGRGVTTYVELVTGLGKLRFEDQKLYWSEQDFGKGDELACEKLDRSWGGGMRKDGTAYFRGHLIFACKGAPGAITGDVTVDCGRITPEERAQLDQGRETLLQERCPEIDKRAAALGTTSRCREDKYSSEVQGCLLNAKDAAAFTACLPTR
jgi:hypothetical protein